MLFLLLRFISYPSLNSFGKAFQFWIGSNEAALSGENWGIHVQPWALCYPGHRGFHRKRRDQSNQVLEAEFDTIFTRGKHLVSLSLSLLQWLETATRWDNMMFSASYTLWAEVEQESAGRHISELFQGLGISPRTWALKSALSHYITRRKYFSHIRPSFNNAEVFYNVYVCYG